MPRNVRNFWITGYIDGQKTRIGRGPTRKDGGFGLRVYQRNEDDVEWVLSIYGAAGGNILTLYVIDKDGNEILTHTTRRNKDD